MTPTARRPQDKLLARLREMGMEIPEGAIVRRVYASASQRNAGAWSWYVVRADGSEAGVGSQWPISELLRGRMVASRGCGARDTRSREDWDVDPYREGEDCGPSLYIGQTMIERES